jgi:transposase
MRGRDVRQGGMVVLMNPEDLVPRDHPLRRVRALADEALADLAPLFEEMYSAIGRPSIPPERLLASSLLMALYSIRSERLFCEQLDYNLLFRWFVRMRMDEAAFDHSTFSANRARLLAHDVTGEFFRRVVGVARKERLTSDEHFAVDGTLIEAWASMKSFRPKGEKPGDGPGDGDPGNPSVDFHGEKRSNATHASTTDPEAKLARKGKGKEAKLCFSGHALMENRHVLVLDVRIEEATGTAERETALEMIDFTLPGDRRITVAADKGYDTQDFVRGCRERHVTPHVAAKAKGSALDGRTTRHPGYAISGRVRKRIEEFFGWCKTVGGLRKTRFKGVDRTQLWAYLVGAAYNLLRMARLIPVPM